MARPTNDRKDKTLILRVNAETKEKIEKKAKISGKSISDYVRDEILGERQSVEDIMQSVMDKAVYRDIKKMCELCGYSTHDFYRGVCELFNEGILYIDEKRLKSKGDWDLEEFVEKCHSINKYPQDVIDMVTKGLR